MTLSKRAVVLSMTGWLIAVGAAPVAAKNLCLGDGQNTFVFENLKKPTPGKSVALRGFYIQNGIAAPFDGSAVMQANKSLAAGIFVHSAVGGINNFTLEWMTTTALAGDASYDADGDFRADKQLSLSVVDCKTVTLP